MGSLIARPTGPASGYAVSRNALPRAPSASTRSRWCGPMVKIRSLSATMVLVSCRERCELRSRWRSMPTSSAPSDADAPSQALVPALDTSTSRSPRSMATFRAIASASGLRQVFPVHTKSSFMCSRVSDEPWGGLAQNGGRDRAGPHDAGSAAGTVHHRRWLRRRERTAVEHAQRAARDRRAPLLSNLARRHRRRNPGSVRAGGGDRVAVRLDEPLERAMRGPPHGDPALRTPQCLRHAALAAGQYERERPGPVSRREVGGVAGQSQVELLEHLAARDEQQERLALRPALEPDQRIDGVSVDRSAEAVHRLRRIGEHTPQLELRQRRPDRRRDLRVGPEWNLDRRARHSSTAYSASTRAKSPASVTFSARSLPRTTRTTCPSRSHSAASSVAVTRSARARRCASTITSRGNPCGVWARQSALRSTVLTIVPSASASLSVSTTGRAAIAGVPSRTAAITRSIVAAPTSGRAASCTRTICASSGRSSRPFATLSLRERPPIETSRRSTSHWKSQGGGSPA